MKVAVVGKGGSGKTTTSAIVARTLGRMGLPVVALDCDSNPNLGISLGVGDTETERLVSMRQALGRGRRRTRARLERAAGPLRLRRPRRCPPGGGDQNREPRTGLYVMWSLPRAVARIR